MIDILHQKPLLGRPINKAHPLARGLVGCWLLNEGSGLKVFDLSGYGNDGTLNDMTESDWIPGEKGSVLTFDGSDDEINFGNPPSLNFLPLFTYVGRVKFDSLVNEPIWCTDIGATNTNGYLIRIDGGDVFFQLCNSGARDNRSFGSVTTDVWYQIAITCDVPRDHRWWYIDGVLVGDMETFEIGLSAGTSSISIGRDQFVEFNGQISEVYVYNRVLSGDEIAWHFREPFAMFQQNRVRWFSIAAPPVAGNPWYQYAQEQ